MWVLEKHSFLPWGLAGYLSPGQVVVCGKASSPRNLLIDPWKFREQKQLECYKKLIYKTRAIKLSTVCVILANMDRGGQKENGAWSGRVAEPSSICQQEGVLPGLGCEEALPGAESIQPSSALWESSSCSFALFSMRSQAPSKDQATGIVGSARDWSQVTDAASLGPVRTQGLLTPSLESDFFSKK